MTQTSISPVTPSEPLKRIVDYSAVAKALTENRESKHHHWILEPITTHNVYAHAVKNVLFDGKSAYHRVRIVDVGPYGRALFLDDDLQTTEGDEMHYHEPIVHLPFLLHGNPQNVLIIGGADCGSAREALRWKTVQSVTMVDIDEVAVNACKAHLPSIAQGAFDDPRYHLKIEDAALFIEKTDEIFDVIICDLSDPEDNSPSTKLFTVEFFDKLKENLAQDGVISVMGSTASLAENPRIFPRTCITAESVFGFVKPAMMFVPSYCAPLGIVIAANTEKKLGSAEEIDRLLSEKANGELEVLDGSAVHAHFALPPRLRRAIAKETEVYTLLDQATWFHSSS